MGLNTEYRATLVKARVRLEGVCWNLDWNITGVILTNKYFQQQYRNSSFILDSDFGFKYFIEIVCTKITL